MSQRAINRLRRIGINRNRVRAAIDALEHIDAARNQRNRRKRQRNRSSGGIGDDEVITAHHIPTRRHTPIRAARRSTALKVNGNAILKSQLGQLNLARRTTPQRRRLIDQRLRLVACDVWHIGLEFKPSGRVRAASPRR